MLLSETTPTPLPAKRKRATTSSTASKKAKKKTVSKDQNQDSAADSPPDHCHNTRTTNDPHPAKSAGLNKQTREEIQAGAIARRNEKETTRERKEQDKAEQEDNSLR